MKTGLSAKERILETLLARLRERQDIASLSTRDIAALAGVNSALINYYYQSKDNLLRLAVSRHMGRLYDEIVNAGDGKGTAIARLKAMIKAIVDIAVCNFSASEMAILFDFRNGSIETIGLITPLLQEHFGPGKSAEQLRLIGLQIVTPLQLLFLNGQAYRQYFGVNAEHEKERHRLVDCVIDNLVSDDPKPIKLEAGIKHGATRSNGL